MLLYLHIPFCDSKCHYCSFNSYINLLHLQNKYFDALLTQLKYELNRLKVNRQLIETIFIGGGTPSTVSAKLYKNIFETIYPFLYQQAEITVEANPNSLNKEWITQMKGFGVNRISIGVQSFDEKKLKFLGRNHSSHEAKKAVEIAYNIGIKNVSIDLIYDTCIDNKELLQKDLDISFSLPINHLSAYSLTIEKGTTFYNKSGLTDDKYTEWFIDKIKERFTQYEISNFGEYKSKHNIGYWELKDYIGVGSGAVGFVQNKRYYPHKNVQSYIKNPLYANEENLTQENLKMEKIFLGLRSIVGVDINLLNKNEVDRVKLLEKERKISIKNDRIFNNNFLLSDEIALFLIQD